ncbi:hypothetical protein CCAX7_35880 [Capsulimonas corticalis]|uniref:Uncharacterized protein n=1 Tax=Capsulimonas corticalis TaxID=2219043 RepID=A0A402D676_9BACT|nr:AAA-like domain-containing protein [Capsulimonas corticalis]BDI31537.1 hypothetical protein CCAX7_35880 [Capsulimonas corticalis]
MTPITIPEAPVSGVAGTDAFYVTGGTLGAGAASYVERRADHDLLDGLTSGDYCYVLNSRQMGKSSLCVRTMARLREKGWRTCFLDLTKFGGRNLSAEQWYTALLSEAGRELGLRAEMLAFWKANANLGPMQRFFGAIQQVALPASESPLTVFVDEIDVTRGLPFSADEFFAGIRQCYVGRATDPALNRLTICLLGTATPADLIQDTRTSPFNIGRRIEVKDFTPKEAIPLARGLGENGPALLSRVLYWTGGHPYLTQRLCRAIQEGNASTSASIDKLCSDLFLTRTAAEADDNLAFVRNRLLKSEVDLAGLLDLYGQMRRGRRIPDDEADPLSAVLKLSGVARTQEGQLRVGNRIYEHVFSREWIVEHMPGAELRRQREAYRRGLLRAGAVAAAVVLLVSLLAASAVVSAHRERAATHAAHREQAKVVVLLEQQETTNLRLQDALTQTNEANKTAYTEARKEHSARQEADQKAHQADQQAKIAAHETKIAMHQTIIAKAATQNAKDKASDANRQKQAAQASGRSEKQARLASEHLRYVSDMQLAAQSWADGNPNAAAALLDAHVPGSPSNTDSKDQRDFSWRFQWGLMHRDCVTLIGPDTVPLDGAFTTDGTLLTIDNAAAKLTRWDVTTHHVVSTKSLQGLSPVDYRMLSPDGRSQLVRDHAGRLALLDPATLRVRCVLMQNAPPLRTWAFDPTGHYLAVVSQANVAQIWDTTTGKVVHEPHAISTIGSPGPNAAGCPAALAPDGNTLLLANFPQPGHVTLFRSAAEGFKASEVSSPLSGTISTIACSPDGKWFACGDNAGNISVRDMDLRQVAPRFTGEGQRSNVYHLTFSPDSKILAAGGRDGSLRLWNVPEGTLRRSLLSRSMAVTFINWRADGKALAAGSEYGTTTVWNAALASESCVMPFPVSPAPCAFSLDGHWLATTGQTGEVVLWNMRTSQVECRLGGPYEYASSLAFTPDSHTLAVGTNGPGPQRMQFWNPVTHRLVRTWKMPTSNWGDNDSILGIDISHDGNLLAASLIARRTDSETIQPMCAVWNLRTGGLLASLPGSSTFDGILRFSPDNRMLAVTGGDNNRVWEWRVGEWGRPYRTFAGPDVSDESPVVISLAYSPDGRLLAAGGFSGLIGLYDPKTGILQRRLTGHTDAVGDLNFSPDGRLLASASHDHTVKLWDVAGNQEIRTITAHMDVVDRAVFSPIGDCLATAGRDATLRLWAAPALPAIDARMQEEKHEYIDYQARQAQRLAAQAQRLAMPAVRAQQPPATRDVKAQQRMGRMSPLTLTGYNHDVIAEKEPGQSNDIADSLKKTTTATVDDLTDFYAPGFNPRFPKVGLPAGTRFASRDDPLISFALQPASGNNVLLLRAEHSQGDLALVRPARFNHLAFLVAGFNGAWSGAYRLDFADGHSSTGAFIAPDNFDNQRPNVALGGFGRVFRQGSTFTAPSGALPDGRFENCQPDDPNLFDIPITLSPADAQRTLVRISFINKDQEASGNDVAILGIFGVSGHAAPGGIRAAPGRPRLAGKPHRTPRPSEEPVHP